MREEHLWESAGQASNIISQSPVPPDYLTTFWNPFQEASRLHAQTQYNKLQMFALPDYSP